MCGRYTLTAEIDQVMTRFGVSTITADYQPRYNIAPGQLIMAVIADSGKRRIGQLKWGLVPFWAKDEKLAFKMINARAETVHEKPAYKHAFQRKRCIIPADGFYEWKATPAGKQPMRITLRSGEIFGMAGLFDTWEAPDGRKVHTCTILTTKPNELMAEIHDRMPVILRPEDEEIWLNRDAYDQDLLLSLCQPFPAEEMRAYPVSQMVGNVRIDSSKCIEEYLPE
ncbi:SOS response-associated peptidase [Effusibacillus pohliae]|uniref:SOS response-associated peptidase n=1 Tax=Effusibacillus pohliae TaxID=232270 RepID=UPI00036205F2|nr:SOS response-associated peptidase [Effusibacillus pohliae]